MRAARKRKLEREQALTEARTLGVPVEVDQGEALLKLVYEANGNLAYWRSRVKRLSELAVVGPNGDAKPDFVVAMYDLERDRLANLASVALRAGVEERQIRMAELAMVTSLGVLMDAIDATLTELGIVGEPAEEFRHRLSAEIDSRRMGELVAA